MNFPKVIALSFLFASTAYAAGESKGFSLASLTSLLNGGAQAVTAKTMSNTAGVMEYCVKRKITEATDPENIKNKLKEKLGLNDSKASQQKDYQDGLQGLLKLKNDKVLDLNTLGSSALGEKVKSKACDVALSQGVNFITK
ncbi:DUF2501 domain-containing protein [Budviciaceae bacterium CWB-B4]|uniref:DUF2501 domain-containing protein n=2 Tax=Limnobaculum xujianqingii TaxID=2738837 RepID=A0A9D7FXN0_9GAMM|nr:DUF2501 domain-containing protein [Limnobaculum xujianqingii]MBK5176301.1 DUF2501 domain-containing protein [Limnobaculum xujianqingii]